MRLGVLQPVIQFYAPGVLTKDGLKNFFEAHCMIVYFSVCCSKTQVMIAMTKTPRRKKGTGTGTIPRKQQHHPLLLNSTQTVQG